MTVTQFHYTAWPDHGVPDNVMSIIKFIRHIRKLFPASRDPPLLVHCSAGVGRTGTFITLDMMILQMKAEGTFSVCQCIKHLRKQRMKMVQTQVRSSFALAKVSFLTRLYDISLKAQYEFIHHALSELVMCGETEVTASNLRSHAESLREPGEGSGPSVSQQHMTVCLPFDVSHITGLLSCWF